MLQIYYKGHRKSYSSNSKDDQALLLFPSSKAVWPGYALSSDEQISLNLWLMHVLSYGPFNFCMSLIPTYLIQQMCVTAKYCIKWFVLFLDWYCHKQTVNHIYWIIINSWCSSSLGAVDRALTLASKIVLCHGTESLLAL